MLAAKPRTFALLTCWLLLRTIQVIVLGSGPDMVAALREALGPDVHLPASVLCCSSSAPPLALPVEGAGVVDVGACCFEYIADVEARTLAAEAVPCPYCIPRQSR